MAASDPGRGGRFDIIDVMKRLDRRIIFVFIAAAVVIPQLIPLNLPLSASPPSRALHQAVENLPRGSVVLVAFDYDPSTLQELDPMAVAFMKHCFSKGHKIIGMALWPMGASIARAHFSKIAREEFGLKYGVDYLNLGYKFGGLIVIDALGKDFRDAFPKDIDGISVDEFPIMSNIRNLRDIDFVMDLSAGDPGIPFWVMIAQGRYSREVGGGCTAVSAPQFYPYLESGQLAGLLGGMKGAAEYEKLVAVTGTATRGMDSQSIAHAAIVFFVITGNVFFFIDRRRAKKRAKER